MAGTTTGSELTVVELLVVVEGEKDDDRFFVFLRQTQNMMTAISRVSRTPPSTPATIAPIFTAESDDDVVVIGS